MVKCNVEAGIGGPIELTAYPQNVIASFYDSAVHLSIESLPQSAEALRIRDLRITHWVTIQFETDDEHRDNISFLAREMVDRIVDILSTLAGDEIRVFHWLVRYTDPAGQWKAVLRPTAWISRPTTKVDIRTILENKGVGERHYRALRHLRHGLSQTSPEKRFGSLILAVLILSRFFELNTTKTTTCEKCGNLVAQHGPGDRDYLLNLAEVLPGWKASEIEPLWKLRNALIAHGNEHLDADSSRRLQEASFTAVRLAYDALNASLPGLNLVGPSRAWLLQDIFMLMDSGDHAHEGAIDIGIQRNESGEWVATWPSSGPVEITMARLADALEEVKSRAETSMKAYVRTEDRPASVRLRITF